MPCCWQGMNDSDDIPVEAREPRVSTLNDRFPHELESNETICLTFFRS